jgi:hypothetical protein
MLTIWLATGTLGGAPVEQEARSKGYLPIIYLDGEKKVEPEAPAAVVPIKPVAVEKPIDTTGVAELAYRLELPVYGEIAANVAKVDAALSALVEQQRIDAENDELALILLLAA